MKIKDFLLIGILIIAIVVGYDSWKNGASQTWLPPVIYATPQPPVFSVSTQEPQVLPTWTPEPINFQATTDAYLNSLPTPVPPTPVVLVATRPPFENLPPQGPYGPNEIAVCKATWEQGYEGQLSMFQQQYELCYNTLLNSGFFN